MASKTSGHHLTSEQHNRRVKIRTTLAVAHGRMKDECKVGTTATINSARKKLLGLMEKLDADVMLYDLPTRDFFYARQTTHDLLKLFMDERIHMLSEFLGRPLEDTKKLVESVGCEFSLALEWMYMAFHDHHPPSRRNTWMGFIPEVPASP